MSDATETICHWEQVERRWKWEWASYHPHAAMYWAAGGENGVTELLDDAALMPDAPTVSLDLAYGSRWEKVSGTGTNVVLAAVDLLEGERPAGQGWQMVEAARR